MPLYHGTTPENAASIRASGIDLSSANPRTDFGPGYYTARLYEQALARAGGDPAGVLTYNVPASTFDSLSGVTFADGGSDYAAFLRSIRSGEMHSYDYVEGPVHAVTRVLLEHGADIDAVNKFGNSPLLVAMSQSRGRTEEIILLRDMGADRNLKNKAGVSAVDLARTITNFDFTDLFPETHL